MNRIDRLMGTLLLLQSRRVIRAEDIAERFEISLRTVYRDVSALSEIGVPIVAEAGVGYSLMRGYSLPPIMFTEEEAAALGMAALALSKTSDPSLDSTIRAALLKVRAALPERQRDRLDRVEDSVVFGWNGYGEKPDGKGVKLVDLQSALAQSRKLRIRYKTGGRDEVSDRVVEPLGLIHYLEFWHLIAWCSVRKDYRDFRLDRIQNLDVLPEKVELKNDFNLQDYLRQQRATPTEVRTRILFERSSVGRAKREWSLGFRGEEELESGSILILETVDLRWMVGWLMSFGNKAQVVEPAELKSMLVEEASRLMAHHGGA